jgi:two-component system chemotaxis response regulator CheB
MRLFYGYGPCTFAHVHGAQLRFKPGRRPAVAMSAAAEWVIVIGGSAGALTSLRTIVSALPSDAPAACCVVIHTSASGGVHLPDIIRRWTSWTVKGVSSAEPLRAGHIYVARPNLHLKLTAAGIEGTREVREHHVRPAVDVLFRSAARAFGSRGIAIILSGYGGDGAAGAIAIHAHRGTVIVQRPDDAEVPGMPDRTIATAPVDHVVSAGEIAGIIKSVMRRVEISAEGGEMANDDQAVRTVIAEDIREQERGARNGQTAVVSCPDCGGVMWQTDLGQFVDFACHVGHRYSSDTLMVQKTEQLEAALVTALRLLREKSILLRQTAARARTNGQQRAAESLDEQAAIDERYAELLRTQLLEAEPSALSNAAVDEELRRIQGGSTTES